ncbi:DNA-binding response OmpR family regulator [Methylopila capsulata]|uniref:Regulatory protein VirG n=1 Tax=Methylopila capsulata TaxID=61654 RepID=A0A9W6IUC6_9HYPH|nr:response regulator transcription factor [Methylopila capsulata]MBM7852493.1 DNA-binding response OmpR family regulator [Methylopila capsulata]GLK56702.1 DNA-binding response regulator [Methylopila capsulata]
MADATHILVVDDDEEIRKLLSRYLLTQGFRVSTASDGKELRERLGDGRIDLIVLDVLLPDASGIDLCRDLRKTSTVPVILLTALKEDVDRIIGLEIGADDYIGKPFNPRELVARIRAVLRRTVERSAAGTTARGKVFRFAEFVVDKDARRVADTADAEIPLTAAEFDLLIAFLERPGRVLSREQLLDITQGRGAGPFDRSIDVLVSRVRRKLGDGGTFQILKTLRNGGYQLTARVETDGADA